MIFEVTGYEERYIVEKEGILPDQFLKDCKEAAEAYRMEMWEYRQARGSFAFDPAWADPGEVVTYLCEKLWYKEIRTPKEQVVFCPRDLSFGGDDE